MTEHQPGSGLGEDLLGGRLGHSVDETGPDERTVAFDSVDGGPLAAPGSGRNRLPLDVELVAADNPGSLVDSAGHDPLDRDRVTHFAVEDDDGARVLDAGSGRPR